MRVGYRRPVAALPLLVILAVLGLTTPAPAAQSLPGSGSPADSSRPGPNVSSSHADVPVLKAALLTGTIRVDGHLDDAAWRDATPVDQFTQRQPDEGSRPRSAPRYAR
jgi:hypothetical protein